MLSLTSNTQTELNFFWPEKLTDSIWSVEIQVQRANKGWATLTYLAVMESMKKKKPISSIEKWIIGQG